MSSSDEEIAEQNQGELETKSSADTDINNDKDIDLSPRDSGLGNSDSSRSIRNWLIGLSIVLALGFILYKSLSGSSEYFRNVDEALAEKGDDADRTLRMQGVVLTEPGTNQDDYVFAIGFNGAQAVVHHEGVEPTDLFACGQNVVVKGAWRGDIFVSEQILIKHSEDYKEENPDRLAEADQADSNKCLEVSGLKPDTQTLLLAEQTPKASGG